MAARSGAVPGRRCGRGARRPWRPRKRAFPAWRATPVAERVRLMKARRGADRGARLRHRRGAVPRGRQEPHGGARRGAGGGRLLRDLLPTISSAATAIRRALADDPLTDYRSHNRSVLKPYGVWVVIAPFNFPLALPAGPTAAALITGNTVVPRARPIRPGRAACSPTASAMPGCRRESSTTSPARAASPARRWCRTRTSPGITFTGSHAGRHAHLPRHGAAGAYPRPCIAEMGGKNACIVTAACGPRARGCRASCARPSAWADRSARRCRGLRRARPWRTP